MEQEFRHLIRIMNTDLEGKRQVGIALRNIKGIGFQFASTICKLSKIDRNKRAGDLTDAEVSKIEEVIKNPAKFGMPTWTLNRQRDFETGQTHHLVLTDLNFVVDEDIKRLKKIKCWRGLRHAFGQPCRGQRTKSHFRRNKGKVLGVKKKAGASRGRV